MEKIGFFVFGRGVFEGVAQVCVCLVVVVYETYDCFVFEGGSRASEQGALEIVQSGLARVRSKQGSGQF
jgi:hypothetical protein